jgi:hypothetical protein
VFAAAPSPFYQQPSYWHCYSQRGCKLRLTFLAIGKEEGTMTDRRRFHLFGVVTVAAVVTVVDQHDRG